MEHDGIRASIVPIFKLVTEQFEIAEKSPTDVLPSEQLKILEEKRFNVEQNLLTVESALRNHYQNEKEFLRPLLGNLLKEAIDKEAIEIMDHFNQAKSEVIHTDLKQSEREKVMAEVLKIKQATDRFSQQIEAHTTKIDGVLKLIEDILGPEEPTSLQP
jgi:hypothetical protein